MSQSSIAVKKTHDNATFILKEHLIGYLLHFRGLNLYYHCRKDDDIQANMILEMQMRVLYLDLQEAEKEL